MSEDRTGKMLRVHDVADRLGVSERTVFRWLETHALRGHRLGRAVRISEGDLDDFLSACATKTR